MKTRTKIIILSILILILTFIVLLLCGVFSKKYVTEKELTDYINQHIYSLNVVNEYVLNLDPDDDGDVRLNLDRVYKQQSQMTQEQYDACIEIFTGKYIDYYCRHVEPSHYYERLGIFSVTNNPPDYDYTITCTPTHFRDREYTRIVGDWFFCKNFPHKYTIDRSFELKIALCSCLFIIVTIITVCVIIKRRKIKEIRAIMARNKKDE